MTPAEAKQVLKALQSAYCLVPVKHGITRVDMALAIEIMKREVAPNAHHD